MGVCSRLEGSKKERKEILNRQWYLVFSYSTSQKAFPFVACPYDFFPSPIYPETYRNIDMSDQSPLATASPSASPSRLQVALTVGFHIGTALAVTIINKAVLNTLPVPVMLLLCQSVMCIVFIGLGYVFRLYTPPRLDYTFIRSVAPLLVMKLIAQLSKTYCLLVRGSRSWKRPFLGEVSTSRRCWL